MNALWSYRTSVCDYRESTWTLDSDLVGYVVEATDGRLGTVVRASSSSDVAYLVVDGPSAAAGRRLVPARVVTSIRHDDRTVRIDLTGAQLLAAPAYEDEPLDDTVRAAYDHYFSGLDRR
ncbi:MAG: PRC-barrel domain containing protein [Terrabacter sp.]|nr:PRC-barrel domain containing protein [Terrabacter sp.]